MALLDIIGFDVELCNGFQTLKFDLDRTKEESLKGSIWADAVGSSRIHVCVIVIHSWIVRLGLKRKLLSAVFNI